MAFWNRKYKDSVFTDLFGSDRDGKKNFLELYNALSGNDYKLNEVDLERKIIEQSPKTAQIRICCRLSESAIYLNSSACL